MILLICIYNNVYIIATSTIIHAHLVGVYFVFTAFHLPVLAGQSSWRGNITNFMELLFVTTPHQMNYRPSGVLSTMSTLSLLVHLKSERTKEDMPHFLMQIVLLRIQTYVNLFQVVSQDGTDLIGTQIFVFIHFHMYQEIKNKTGREDLLSAHK
ncbi:hypothetical protein ACJX0J_040016 [Zea mays]